MVGLTKMFGAFKAVDDLTFSVQPGAVTGFLGPNGAGKTTTLRCLLGLLAPTAGSATIGGQPLPRPARPDRHRRRGARGVELPPRSVRRAPTSR